MLTKLIDPQAGEEERAPRMDTRVPSHIRVLNGSLDDDPDSPGGIILIGRIDPSTFRFLKIDESYQRPLGDRPEIFAALKDGKIPPSIDIGVRGQDFVSDGADYVIRSPAYIVDGLQRLGNAKRLLELVPQLGIRLFGMFHFGTDEAWERVRFDDLNKNVRKVSASHHLRNMRGENDAILTLFGLSNNSRDFVLYKKVCWSQNMERGQLLKALVLAKTMRVLHAHHTSVSGASADGIAASLAKAAANISLPIFRSNVGTFFSTINECWPIAAIEYRHKATHLKHAFLHELAKMFANHPAFWDASGKRLVLSADDRNKLGKFPINDAHIVNLAGSSGKSRLILYRLLVDHMNSGRRTNRLIERGGA